MNHNIRDHSLLTNLCTQVFRYRVLLLFFAFLAVSVTYLYQKDRELVFSITIHAKDATAIQLYYDIGQGFNADHVLTASVQKEQAKELRFELAATVKQLRFDPAIIPTEINLSQFSVTRGFGEQAITSLESCMLINHQVSENTIENGQLTVITSGADPQLLVPPSCIPDASYDIDAVMALLTKALTLSLIATAFISLAIFHRATLAPVFVAAVFGVITFQILILSLFTAFNAHPDEFGHVLASRYFQKHWFEAAVDSPEMMATLMQNWGSTYLHLNDMVYFLAEKTTSGLGHLVSEDYRRYRLFNFILFPALLLIFTVDYKRGLWFLFAIALTAQTWYLFSYFNGDALGMFYSLLLGYWYVRHQSAINDQLLNRLKFDRVLAVFYLLCVAVFFARFNYAVFVFFILGIIFFQPLAVWDIKSTFRGGLRLSVLLLLAAAPAGLHELSSEYTNDFRKTERIEAVKQEHRPPQFDKQYILETGDNPNRLYLKDTNVSYAELLTESNWLYLSYRSFFGVYGYMNVIAPDNFYLLSSISGVGLLILYLIVSAIRSNSCFRITVALFFFSIMIVILQSTIYSWTWSFQAQGRYCLAIIPMFAVVLSLVPDKPPQTLTVSLLLIVSLINLYGFSIYGVLPLLS